MKEIEEKAKDRFQVLKDEMRYGIQAIRKTKAKIQG
jgi:hypothetical protein